VNDFERGRRQELHPWLSLAHAPIGQHLRVAFVGRRWRWLSACPPPPPPSSEELTCRVGSEGHDSAGGDVANLQWNHNDVQKILMPITCIHDELVASLVSFHHERQVSMLY
jgi:hypothetical protein